MFIATETLDKLILELIRIPLIGDKQLNQGWGTVFRAKATLAMSIPQGGCGR